MEKYIYIIKSISTLNGNTRTDNVFAVTSEQEAMESIEKFNSRKKDEIIIENFDINYIYERIRLFD